MKISKQDGERRMFIMDDGTEIPFDQDGKRIPTEPTPKVKKSAIRVKRKHKESLKKLNLDNPIELADFKHGSLNMPDEANTYSPELTGSYELLTNPKKASE